MAKAPYMYAIEVLESKIADVQHAFQLIGDRNGGLTMGQREDRDDQIGDLLKAIDVLNDAYKKEVGHGTAH